MKQPASKNTKCCKTEGTLLLLEESLSTKIIGILIKFVFVHPAAGYHIAQQHWYLDISD